jgi:hypothetical protein
VFKVTENLAMAVMNKPSTTDNAAVNLIPLQDGTLLAASGERSTASTKSTDLAGTV